MFEFKVERVIAEISNYGTNAKRLTLTSWGGRPAKLDLRTWRTEEKDPQPGKGLTLSLEEAEALADALKGFLANG